MNQTDPSSLEWVKAASSYGNGNCVEVAALGDGAVAVRDSKHPDGPMLSFTGSEWSAFFAGLIHGDFDTMGPRSRAIVLRQSAVVLVGVLAACAGAGGAAALGILIR
jgi:Domain of unknown function (DUF397)